MEMKDKIKMLRLQQHKTLEQVGQEVGVGKSTVRKWENGDIANMRRDKIAKLAEALHTTPAYLMGWEEEPPPPPDDILDKTLRRLLARATDEDKQMLIALLERMQEK